MGLGSVMVGIGSAIFGLGKDVGDKIGREVIKKKQ
jgi:hypothetical protein